MMKIMFCLLVDMTFLSWIVYNAVLTDQQYKENALQTNRV